MKKLVLAVFTFIAFSGYAQQEIEAKELSKKEIRALLKPQQRKKKTFVH